MTDEQMADLERSIREFGCVDPVIARRATREIIDGHERLIVARRLGFTEVPVIFLDISEERAKLLGLALNKIAGTWDERRLAELLRAVPEIDRAVSGFHDDEVNQLFASLEAIKYHDKGEDFDVAAELERAREQSRVRPGEAWELGHHLVMCGDATNAADVDALVGPDGADLVVSDPPFNVAYRPEGSPSGRLRSRRRNHLGPIEGDAMSPAEYDAFLTAAFGNVVAALPRGGSLYICGGTGNFSAYERAFGEVGIHLSSVIVWDKGRLNLTRKDYHSQYEFVFYGWPDGKAHRFYGGRSQTDVWAFPHENGTSYLHPNQKPLELIERAIRNSSRPGDTVLDLFAGSGTTLIAAERTGRRCLAMDIDPRWCEVTIRRWEDLTSGKARRLR